MKEKAKKITGQRFKRKELGDKAFIFIIQR
jgi:hypothetical protein